MVTAEQALQAWHTFGEIATGLGVIFTGVISLLNRRNLRANHKQLVETGAAVVALKIEVDGRLSELLLTTAKSANALGQIAGRAAQRSDEASELATAGRLEADRVATLAKHTPR